MGTVVPQAAGSSSSDAAAAIGVMLRERDIALKTPLDDVAVAQLPSRLRFLESLGVDDLGKAARLCPELLHSEPAAIAPRLEYLLGLGVSDIATAVKHAPALLSCDMTRDFHLKVAILASLGVTDIAHFVTSNPRIVNLDVDKDMRPAVELLR
jgi:mTERF domain-containing protein